MADVGGRAEQISVGAQHVGGARGQRGQHGHLDVLDLVGAGSAQHGLEHGLHRRRRRVVHE
jgi:hypothetical protein